MSKKNKPALHVKPVKPSQVEPSQIEPVQIEPAQAEQTPGEQAQIEQTPGEPEQTEATESLSQTGQPLTLGTFAHQTITEQVRRILKQEGQVLADKDPEHLHQMRVGTRRLRTALKVFGEAIALPKKAGEKSVKSLAKSLGDLRDLDVQIATLEEDYLPQLDGKEQKSLQKGIDNLRKQRRKAFDQVEQALHSKQYQAMKDAYQDWLQEPHYQAIAQLSLRPILPDLLSPLMSELLLHPGWLIPQAALSPETSPVLHDLRKACKRVRYQAEFFEEICGSEFKGWVRELKTIQDSLGDVQDGQVLLDFLPTYLAAGEDSPNLRHRIRQQQQEAIADWDQLRERYLDPAFRQHLRQLILSTAHEPTPTASEPDKSEG